MMGIILSTHLYGVMSKRASNTPKRSFAVYVSDNGLHLFKRASICVQYFIIASCRCKIALFNAFIEKLAYLSLLCYNYSNTKI